jgi:hypothetical protein
MFSHACRAALSEAPCFAFMKATAYSLTMVARGMWVDSGTSGITAGAPRMAPVHSGKVSAAVLLAALSVPALLGRVLLADPLEGA